MAGLPAVTIRIILDYVDNRFSILNKVAFHRQIADLAPWAAEVYGFGKNGVDGFLKEVLQIFTEDDSDYGGPWFVRNIREDQRAILAKSRHGPTTMLLCAVQTEDRKNMETTVSKYALSPKRINRSIILKELCATGRYHDVRWFMEKFVTEAFAFSAELLTGIKAACNKGHFTIAQWLFRTYGGKIKRNHHFRNRQIAGALIVRGRESIARWFIENFEVKSVSGMFFVDACEKGRCKTARLYREIWPHDADQAILVAGIISSKQGKTSMLLWVLDVNPLFPRTTVRSFVRLACENGHYRCAKRVVACQNISQEELESLYVVSVGAYIREPNPKNATTKRLLRKLAGYS